MRDIVWWKVNIKWNKKFCSFDYTIKYQTTFNSFDQFYNEPNWYIYFDYKIIANHHK